MALTTQQKATLKANILATPAANAMYESGDLSGLAAFYNATASPDFYVWRTAVSQDEIMLNGFDWTRVDNLSVGKARIWEWLFFTGAINPSKTNIRAGIDATWVGTAADLAVRAAVYQHCQRLASVVEKLFSTGAGTTVTNGTGPATMALEGPLAYTEFQGL